MGGTGGGTRYRCKRWQRQRGSGRIPVAGCFCVQSGIKNVLQEYVPRSLLRQLFGNQNIDEDVRAITEAGDHLGQCLTPPSSSQRSGGSEFKVFLSFRGKDTRKGFTAHLYDSLQDHGVSTFIDSEELEKGENIDKLLEYMKKSEICVPIISESYAESKWCLKKLTTSVECDMKIIPVFFEVEPSDVRNQSGLSNLHLSNMNLTRS